MRTIRVAALTAAAVGLGAFAVGCGAQPSTGGSSNTGTTKPTVTSGSSTGATGKPAAGGDLASKAKSATEDLNKGLTPLKVAFDKLKAKIGEDEKTAGSDALKLTAVGMLKEKRDHVEKLLKEIDGKMGGLAGAKDDKALDDAKKAITELFEKTKPLLQEYLVK